MPRRVTVRGGGVDMLVELREGALPEELYARLPFDTKARVVEEELHLPILVPEATEPADRREIESGGVAYLPEENALCFFFGARGETRTGEVTQVGRVLEGLESCREASAHQTLRFEAAGDAE